LFQRIMPALRRGARGRRGDCPRVVAYRDTVQDTLTGRACATWRVEARHPGSLLAYLRLALLKPQSATKYGAPPAGSGDRMPAEWPDGGASPLEQVLGRPRFNRYEMRTVALRIDHRKRILCGLSLE